ncbi:winged helix-turn-helix domain-containing protein [Paenibacillus enshidis]|uniref:Winged helix-turn-helix domain-containing protein n=1 Tax=Paenibacillus enshidis TaxID=1458439 RepID=A0ABV5AY91_9BACL
MEVLMFSNKISNEDPILKSIFKMSEINLTQINNRGKLKELILEQHRKYIAVILDLQICSNDDLSFWKQLLDLSPLPILILSSDTSKSYHDIRQQKATIHLAKPITDFCRHIHDEEKQKQIDELEFIPLTKEVFFNITGHCIRKDNRCTSLSSTEFKLLFLLVRNRGQIFSSHKLLDQLDLPGLSTLYVHIQNIRSKIEKDPHNPVILINHRGRGYSVKTEA